jgi:hypothetical protein
MQTKASSQVDDERDGLIANQELVLSDSDSDQSADEHDQAVE